MDGFARENRLPAFSFYGSFDRGTGIFIGNNSQLGGQTKIMPEFSVSLMVDSECVGVFAFITNINDKILGGGMVCRPIVPRPAS